MADEGFKRKLAAILSADVEGYSRLMDDDEAATVRTLSTYRSAIANLVQQFRGRIVDTPGDNILAEFTSVVDAVNCAVEIQKELVERNEDLSDERKMRFRIGVNLGDVIDEEERLYGDGVNIAARVEGLSDAGGICISHSAYDQIKNKLKLGYEYLGEHKVKNIREPVKTYRVLMEPEFEGKLIGFDKKASNRKWVWVAAAAVVIAVVGLGIWQFYLRRPSIEPASEEKMAFPLPDKPSIAVLAFDNMSGDPEQEYFSDGIAENIITALSKVDELFVIARNSSFTYKGKPVKVKQVAEELGVHYVLEGSVRKSEEQVRITAQLIDATNGHHLWAENYDRDFKDIFEIQDELTKKIVTSLRIKLSEGEQARIFEKQSKNLDVFLKQTQALSLWRKGTKESLISFGKLGQEIVDIEPEISAGYRILGWYHWGLATRGISPRESIGKSFKFAQKALSLDEFDALSHSLLGSVYLMMRKYEKAIESGQRSVKLEPNGAMVHGLLGMTLSFAGRPDEAIGYLNKGIRLNPFPAYWYYSHLGRSYLLKGQYDDALTTYKKALNRAPDALYNHVSLAIIYALLDRREEAEAAAKKVLEINPNFSVGQLSKASPYKNPADLKLVVDAMHKAGLP